MQWLQKKTLKKAGRGRSGGGKKKNDDEDFELEEPEEEEDESSEEDKPLVGSYSCFFFADLSVNIHIIDVR